MKVNELLEAFLKLFNDLIGAVIPGLVLILGLAIIHTEHGVSMISHRLPSSDWGAAIVVTVSYAAGHVLISLASLGETAWNWLKEQRKTPQKTSNNFSYDLFKRYIELQIRAQRFLRDSGTPSLATENVPFNELRNIAMTMSAEAAALGYRFMSISLFCNGVGTALCVIVLDALLCGWILPNSIVVNDVTGLIAQSVVLLFVAFLLFRRAYSFRRRALDTPFSIALTQLLFAKQEMKKGT